MLCLREGDIIRVIIAAASARVIVELGLKCPSESEPVKMPARYNRYAEPEQSDAMSTSGIAPSSIMFIASRSMGSTEADMIFANSARVAGAL